MKHTKKHKLNSNDAREILDSVYRGAAHAESANACVCETFGFDREELYKAVARTLIEFYGITQEQREAYIASMP